MKEQIRSLDQLVHELSFLPGVGEKTALRLSYYILRCKDDYPERLIEALNEVKEKVHLCQKCFSYTEEETNCLICQDHQRDEHIVCVVEDPSDIFRIEASESFHGKYHVLQGSIAPLDGVHPENLKITELIERINLGLNGEAAKIEELILAFDADLEGDTTALYLVKQLEGKSIKITRLAHGVPFGSDIDYIDKKTLSRALINRVEL